MKATREHIIKLGKYHSNTQWYCDLNDCDMHFDREDEVIQHQEDDHDRKEIFT